MVLGLSAIVSISSAQEFSYTTFNQQAFQKHWGLTDDQVASYLRFMSVEGKYRYKELTPLDVLSIAAYQSGEETMGDYWAKRAAENELQAVKAQLLYAIKTTEYKTQIAAKLNIEAKLKKGSEQAQFIGENEIIKKVTAAQKKKAEESKKSSTKKT